MKGSRTGIRFGLRARLVSPALLAVCCAAAPTCTEPQDEARVLWKPVPMALLRVDDRAPKNWQVYGAEKRKHSLLVQMGGRFLLLDVQAKRVYELALRTLMRKNDTLEWTDPDAADSAPAKRTAVSGDSPATPRRLASATSRQASASKSAAASSKPALTGAERDLPDKALLPSTGWSMRDVGPMLRIRLRLTSEGRNFDIQIPIQPDLRQFY
ncbi:MAG: hypothetical protein ACRD5W_10915 [Candidatus Acidiferrales bacterium]